MRDSLRMIPPLDWPTAASALALAPAALYLIAALVRPRGGAFRAVQFASGAAFALALGLALATAVAGTGAEPVLGVRIDVVTRAVLLLVTGIGFTVVRYSRRYLAGDAGEARYARWLAATLAAVSTLVVADHLAVLAAAWTATSVTLHQLLTHYERPAAHIAAHKKFLASRLADVCLWTGLALVQLSVGSLSLTEITAWAGAREALPLGLHAATVLFALAACIKSAQLPLHGWLTQVMEAPTPVSALLHAGIVNLGGFLMIRLAGLMALSPVGQALLVVVGLTTALLAALIMTTRISIKVTLAWSTCAQMGLMLVQCGLGLWHLALLHLLAHSLYKAHAFLSSGGAVEQWRVAALAPVRHAPTVGRWGLACLLSLALVAGVAALSVAAGVGHVDGGLAVLLWIVALSLVPMLGRGLVEGPWTTARVALGAAGVVGLYLGWHTVAERLFVFPEAPAAAWSLALVGLGFTALFALQTAVQLAPAGRLARALHDSLFAGLFLDERFTRLTFRVWPPRLPEPAVRPAIAFAETTEA